MSISKIKNKNPGYLALCYHYVRDKQNRKLCPRIMGTSKEQFLRHIRMMKSRYQFISLEDAYNFSYGEHALKKKNGMLLTFDDGLADHYLAAQLLAENKIKGAFFIPTCILSQRLPANPIIIHYALAFFGVANFLNACRNAVEELKIKTGYFNASFFKNKQDPWQAISKLKNIFKYKLNHKQGRPILLHIYKNQLLKEYKDAMDFMHLDSAKLKKILAMGHSLGVHSYSHISIASANLSRQDFRREVIEPKNYLEKNFQTKILSLSYPFGEKKDCLKTEELTRKTDTYKLAFTVENILNLKNTPPTRLGRYMPLSSDDEKRLKAVLSGIVKNNQ